MMDNRESGKKKINLSAILKEENSQPLIPSVSQDNDLLLLAALIVQYKLIEIRQIFELIFHRVTEETSYQYLILQSFELGAKSPNSGQTIPNEQSIRILKDAQRIDILKKISDPQSVREIVSKLIDRDNSELEQAFHLYLTGRAPEITKQNLNQLAAAFTVSGWLRQTIFEVPSEEVIQDRIRQEEFLEPFKQLTAGFAGRVPEMDYLYDYVNWLPSNSISSRTLNYLKTSFGRNRNLPVLVNGIGGVGKSTLVAKFILDQLRFEKDKSLLPFIYFDFDRPGLSLAEPLHLVIRAFAQLKLQFPAWNDYFTYATRTIIEEIEGSELRSRSAERESVIEKFGHDFNSSVYYNQPILVVFDSFEELQQRANNYELEDFFRFMQLAAKFVPRLRLLLVGRSDINIKSVEIEKFTLEGFDSESAIAYLKARGVAARAARRVFNQFGGNPLSLQLAAQLIKASGPEADPEIVFKGIGSGVVLQQLITRTLYHIHDEKVRKLAIPGILVRKITPDIIRRVLAEPCKLGDISAEEAIDIYKCLLKETFLINAFDEGVSFRQDVRESVEPMILSDKQYPVKEIHEKAIAYYKGSQELSDKAEYLYHRLKIGDDPEIILELCEPRMRSFLEPSLREFSSDARVIFATKFGISIDEQLLKIVSQKTWEFYLEQELPRILENGDEFSLNTFANLASSRKVIAQRDKEAIYLSCRLYLRLGRYEQAWNSLKRIEELMPNQGGLRLLMTQVNIMERTGDPDSALRQLKQYYEYSKAYGYDKDVLAETAISFLRLIGRFNDQAHQIDGVVADVRNVFTNFGLATFTDSLPYVYRSLCKTFDETSTFIDVLSTGFSTSERFMAELRLIRQQAESFNVLERFVSTRFSRRLKEISQPGTLDVCIYDVALFSEIYEHQLNALQNLAKIKKEEEDRKSKKIPIIEPPESLSKRIIICCDGLWQEGSGRKSEILAETNVEKIYKAILSADVSERKQLKLYERGTARKVNFLSRIFNFIYLDDIEQTIRNIYSFIILNYEPGDDLYFFGFSKGAFIARTIIALIRNCGVLKTNNQQLINDALKIYFDRSTGAGPEGKKAVSFRNMNCHPMPVIQFAGIWETVGELGIPSSPFFITRSGKYKFHDTYLTNLVKFACQALALDETRSAFKPALWQYNLSSRQVLKQAWFPGTHGDVGGGYADSGLSDISLEWMAKNASENGLEIDPNFLNNLKPSVNGRIHDPLVYSDFLFVQVYRKVLSTNEAGEFIHPSVLARIANSSSYRPPNISPDIYLQIENEHKDKNLPSASV